MRHSGLFVFCLLPLLATGSVADDTDFAIKDQDTVVFLGDSITAERTYGKIIENYTLLRFPDRDVRFINAGVGGDTAADGLARLERDVLSHNPTLVTVAFGINDIGWGMTADEAHRSKHLESIQSIVQACVAKGIRVYVCSAAITGNDPAHGEDSFLQKMCDEAMKIARQHGGHSIDVQRGMRKIQQAIWDASEDKSTYEKRRLLHTDDTIHLNELGQLAMAYAILKGLNAPADVSSAILDAKDGTLTAGTGCSISDIERTDDGLKFTRLDAGLPFNNGLFYELNYEHVPVPETLNRYMLTIRNLPIGKYKVLASGRDVGTFASDQLEEGINISSCTGAMWEPGGPWVAQAWVLQSISDARHKSLGGLQQSRQWLAESGVADLLATNSDPVDERFRQMQRQIAEPQPYRFVISRVKNEAAAAADGITIEAPLEYQVIQRHQRTAGRVTIRGSVTAKTDAVQIRVRGTSIEGNLPDEWRNISWNADSSSFQDTVTVPAGGWYQLDVRTRHDDQTTSQATLEHFGVGEVFVGAGQSNSTNAGEFKTKQTSGMVSSFSGEHWQLADDPQPGVADKSQGGSFWPAFGDALYHRYKVPIGVATTGFGGTSVDAWQPDTSLFKWTMTRIEQLGSGGFRALLWHQGESDVAMTSDEYYGKLKRVIDASRKQAGWNIPWFVAQVSYLNPDKPSFDSTRQAQQRIWSDNIAFRGPDTDTLTGDHRDHNGLGIHFSPKGLKVHGNMWADILAEYVDRQFKE